MISPSEEIGGGKKVQITEMVYCGTFSSLRMRTNTIAVFLDIDPD